MLLLHLHGGVWPVYSMALLKHSSQDASDNTKTWRCIFDIRQILKNMLHLESIQSINAVRLFHC